MWADTLWLFSDDSEVGVHGERHYRRAAGPGRGAQARVVVVDEHSQRSRCANTEGGEHKEDLGLGTRAPDEH